MKSLLKIVGFILAAILIITLDISFFPALGSIFLTINLSLSLALFLMVVVDKNYALLLFLLTTLLAGFTGSELLFTPLIIGVFVLILINWLFESFFTNRSYYTLLALGLLGWFTYYLLFMLITNLLKLVSPTSLLPAFSFGQVAGVIFGAMFLLLILSVSYIFTTFFSKKIKSYFIISH